MEGLTKSILNGARVCLLGYGVSNKAMCQYLIKKEIFPSVRNKEKIPLPQGVTGIFGNGYLNADEDIVFRSPGIRGEEISKTSRVYTEATFALEEINAHKIGITGSDGKTTTTTLIYKMLSAEGHIAHACGNIGTPIISLADKVTPDDFLACELSSFQLFDNEPAIDTAVITSISENHLDWHASLAEYLYSKRNILKRARCAVINYDMEYRELFTHHTTTYFSTRQIPRAFSPRESLVYIKDGYIYYNEKRLFPKSEIKLKGEYNLSNALASIGAVYPYVSIKKMREVLSTFDGVEHRSQEISQLGGVTFVDSSVDSSPSRTQKTLSCYPLEKSIVIMGGYDKSLSYECLEGATRGAKLIILMGANREKIRKCITGAKRVILVNNIFEATTLAYKNSIAGDFIILSPASASFDMFKNYIERAEKFKEAIRGLEDGKYKKDFEHLDK